MPSSTDLIAFGIALVASLGLTIPVRRLALRYGMVDLPGPRKVHVKPIPLLGGIAIYLGFVLAILLTRHALPQQQIVGILAGATLVAFVGILDDGGLLHHQVKLFVGMPIAAVFLMASGIRAQVFSQFLPGRVGLALDIAATLFWVVGITASFSILDHMDGLCAGIAAVAAFFFTLSASMSGQLMVRTLGAASVGAALGFLRWNFNPAKIFMGDGGAMLLGFLMATLGLKVRPEGASSLVTCLVPVLILGVPIFDTTLVSISRARRGLLPFTSPGKDHTAHRLANLGLGHRGAVLVLYASAAVCGVAGLTIPYLSAQKAYLLAALAILLVLAAVFLLENAPYERQAKLQKSSSAP
ncbi:MAG TPA: MraY family glycosyltransferase [Candidatus Limnocylindrales bacterium]|nr:MraY family glycosyltransferase [Candidatus Limnocylindrales bacterium]